MARFIMFSILVSAAFILGSVNVATADIAIKDLKCEYLSNPLGIDVAQPRLSWVLESKSRGEAQTAYQILVASSEDGLRADKGDLWDSSKVVSDQSIHVAYAGATLTSEQRCFWKVRVWGRDGKPSHWSEPALWTMGLLQPQDWKAKWIAKDTAIPQQSSLKGSNWIWYPEGDPKQSAPAETRWFRRVVEIAADRVIKSATVTITADNSYNCYVNGQEVGSGSDWKYAHEFDIANLLHPGVNVLAVAAVNENGPAGLIASLTVEFESGEPLKVVTDGEWKTANTEQSRWNTRGFDDSKWPNAMVLGPEQMDPWHSPGLADLKQHTSPLMRTSFQVEKPIKKAYVYVCGLGYYEMHVNGAKVGDTTLDPGFTRYDNRVLYNTYDVTDLLKQGKNAIGVMLGNGWYNSAARDAWDFDRTPWRDTPRLLLQMSIEYADGSHQLVTSDGSWKTSTGPIVFDGIRNGETYDARLEKPGWDTANYSDAGWESVIVVDGPKGKLEAQMTLPNRVVKTITPVSVTEPKPGVFVFDMGQNLSGRGHLTVFGPAGTKVTIKYDERLTPDGLVDQKNACYVYSGGFQTDTYILKGQGTEEWEARFDYHGFQYAQVEGFPGKPTVDNLKCSVVHTDFEQAGTFECSNDLLNKIQHNAQWSYVSNFVGFPTDCPHREKNGWTGDAHIAAEMGLYNFNPMANYTSWIDDFDDVQQEAGDFPGIVPTGGWGYDIGPAWDSAYLLIPAYMQLYCGDTRILEQHYDNAKRLVDYLAACANNHIVEYGLGDWCPPEGGCSGAKTPSSLTSTAYYYIDTLIISKVADMLGKKDDAAKYAALAQDIRKAFNAKFYDTARGMYAGDEQTGLATAIYQGLVDPAEKDKVFANLIKEIENKDGHLWCGILGTKYIMHVLTDNGRADVAYQIANQRTFPSWGHWIEQGATTLWESWHGGESRNHIMFGDVSAWFYEALAGINPDPDIPGFKHIIIRPNPVGDLKWARGEHKSMYGWIRSLWRLDDGKFTLNIEIPANTTATVYIPTASADSVTERGKPASKAEGVKLAGIEDGYAVFEVLSGRYEFAAAR